MTTLNTLQGFGWDWRQNGVVLCVRVQDVSGASHDIQVLVPLSRVWHEFHKELSAVGCPLPTAVGAELTVSGLFSGIAHAVKGAVHAVTHNAVTKAASSVANTAAKYASHAVNSIPVLGPLAKTVTHLLTAPLGVAENLAKGGRIDRVMMNSLKSQIADIKQIAPYAQTVLALVPGVGTGLSGAIGAGLALAQGQNISDAVIAGVRGALPGGALAQSAFNVAQAAMSGKGIDQIALNALPLAPAQKAALVQGISLAKDLANGKAVNQALVDAATHALPAELQKAVQIGAALGHAKSIQSAVGTVASAANLSGAYQTGIAAAKQIKALAPHARVPEHLTHAVRNGLAAHAQVVQIVQHAQAGHHDAQKLVSAFAVHAQAQALPSGARALTDAPRRVRPRYHTLSAASSRPAVGALWPAIATRTVLARVAHLAPAHSHPIAAQFQAHAHNHHLHHGQHPHARSFMAAPARVFHA